MSWRTKGKGRKHRHYKLESRLKPRKVFLSRLPSLLYLHWWKKRYWDTGIYQRGMLTSPSKTDLYAAWWSKRAERTWAGGKASKVHVTGATKVRVVERGQFVTKPIDKVLPPKSWLEKAVKALKKRKKVKIYDPTGLATSMWWDMRSEDKLEIMKEEGKFKRFV